MTAIGCIFRSIRTCKRHPNIRPGLETFHSSWIPTKRLLSRHNHRKEKDDAERSPGGLLGASNKVWIPPPALHHMHQNLVESSDESLHFEKPEKHIEYASEVLPSFASATESARSVSATHATTATAAAAASIDWLATRRAVLSTDRNDADHALLMTPREAFERKVEAMDAVIPIQVHTLLSQDEIAQCLRALGGKDITLLLDDPLHPRMGGCKGMVLVTASTLNQLRSMTDGLVRQLRRRKLQEKGVPGAQEGPEGCRTDPEESWWVVDCQNYVVHLMDETTRNCLKLEDLWSGRDGLHRLNLLDEDAVDEYVAENPAPDEYSRRSFDMDETLKQLQKLRWAVPQAPVKAKPKGKKRKKRSRG